jgi:hypothetical protein
VTADPCETAAIVDWPTVAADLDAEGYAVTGPLLDAEACRRLGECFDDPNTAFRSTVDMARYNFGSGRYRYFDYPLPSQVDTLRHALYPPLARIANDWAGRLGRQTPWPDTLDGLETPAAFKGWTSVANNSRNVRYFSVRSWCIAPW